MNKLISDNAYTLKILVNWPFKLIQMEERNTTTIDNIWKVLLTLTLIIFGASIARSILIPIVFAAFLAIILYPIVHFLQKRGMNLILATIFTLIMVGVIFGIGFYYVISQAKILFTDLPDLATKFDALFDRIKFLISDTSGYSVNEQIDLLKEHANELISSGSSVFGDALLATSSLLTFFTLIPIYIFFILIYKQNFKSFLAQLNPEKDRSYLEIAIEIKDMIHSYIGGLFTVITIVAVLNSIGLMALGLKYAVFMGIIAAVLTIIPYIGIFIGGLLPFFVALLTKDSFIYPLLVVGIMGTVQFLEGNFITPKIVGSKVNVNPLAAIIALVIGAEIWGIAGMILAIPITGMTKILFSHSSRLKPYAFLLQSEGENIQDQKETKFTEKIKALFGKKKD